MNKKCKKCGHTDIDTQYMDDETSEYLSMACKNCGYEWSELTLDNKEVEPIPDLREDFCPQCYFEDGEENLKEECKHSEEEEEEEELEDEDNEE